MFNNQRLREIDAEVFHQIQDIEKKRELENKAFIKGMQQGAEMMVKAIREELKKV